MGQKVNRLERVCFLARPQRIADKVKRRLDTDESALNSTFCLEKKAFGLWTASIVDGWKPPHQQTCVGKSDNIAEWINRLMRKPENKLIYISIMDVIGFHGMQYAYHEL